MPDKQKYHPLLRQLRFVANQKSSENDPSQVSSLDVLNHLLQKNVLTQENIRSAVQSLAEERSKDLTKDKAQTKTEQIPAKRRTRHIALRFFYDGANYSGLAQNLGQESDNSIEKVLFQALLRARLVESRERSGYSRCGRTDRGVSAAGQVVALNLKSAIPEDATFDSDGNDFISNEALPKNEFEKIKFWAFPKTKKKRLPSTRVEKEISEYPYAKILNNLLPPEIRILGWAPVSTEFSARFSATTRKYRYFFAKRQMNLQRIREGLKLLVGKHDFRNFCKMDVEKVYNFERLIHDAELVELSDEVCYLQILGQAFLWHQIRCIAEVLFMIGRGLESPDVITKLHDVKKYPGKPSYSLADEKPLVLHNCGYPNLQVGYSVQNIWTVTCQLEQQWEELTLAATRIRNGIESFLDVSILKEDLITFASNKVTERNKKLERAGIGYADTPVNLKVDLLDGMEKTTTIAWKKALPWLLDHGLVPDSNGLDTSIHIPLLKRSMGTTYEEKVEALKKNGKRRQRFEDNVIKKRKSAEEDAAFYEHMTKQGGVGM